MILNAILAIFTVLILSLGTNFSNFEFYVCVILTTMLYELNDFRKGRR